MKKLFMLLTAAMTLFACQDTTPAPTPGTDNKNQGQLKLAIQSSGSFEVVLSSGAERESREVSVANFKVNIYDGSNNLVKTWEQVSDMPELQSLNAGTYKIVAYNQELQSAAFDNPYFYGEAAFTIAAGKITPVDLTCKLANMMISINYSESFLAFYGSDYQVTVENSDAFTEGDQKLIFAPGETRSGYTKVSPFKITIKAGGNTQVRVVETVKAQDHHIISVDLKPVGSSSILIKIDNTVNNKNVGIIVPGDDQDLGNGGKPKPDNPSEDTRPTIKGVGFNIANPLIISTSKDIVGGICQKQVKAIVSAKDKIQNLIVRIDSPDLGPELLVPMFGGDSFDLANLSPELRVGLTELGLIKESDVIKDSESFTFDVTSFMTLLPENETINHKFHITLIDFKGNQVEVTLSIKRAI